jgi:hypothetical protein
MKVTEVYYLERVKTTDYAFKELKMTAVIEEEDNAAECTRMLEGLVKSQLGLIKGDLNVNITKTETKPVAPITEGTKVETPKAPKKVRKTKAKAEKVVEVVVEVVTKEEVQNSLRDVAVFHKDASKAVALIEQVAGVKTLADVPESKYAEIVAMAKKVVA